MGGETLHKHYYGMPSSASTAATSTSTSTTTTTQSGQTPPMQSLPSSASLQQPSFVHPQKETMKRHRRDKTATFGMVGAGVGTLILPVVGTVVGGVLSGYAANQSLKRHEKK